MFSIKLYIQHGQISLKCLCYDINKLLRTIHGATQSTMPQSILNYIHVVMTGVKYGQTIEWSFWLVTTLDSFYCINENVHVHYI